MESVAIRHLRRGQVIVHATEGVYGLGCMAFDRTAYRQIAALKQRPADKPFIVVVAEFSQIEATVRLTAASIKQRLLNWPAAETWLLPASEKAPSWLLSRDRTIAVRVTKHAQLARLARAVGPLISTSANLPSRPPALNLLQARHYFGHAADFYLSGELTNTGRVSLIRDATTGNVVRT